MEAEELVVSDIHVECKKRLLDRTSPDCCHPASTDTVVTRFVFLLPSESAEDSSEASGSHCLEDGDGDLVVRRRSATGRTEVFAIEHGIATTLQDVGLQVWAGALVMCDFIVTHSSIFRGRTCVELGGGSGLTSLTLSLFASHVICTDFNVKALRNSMRNVNLNAGSEGRVRVRHLDWFEESVRRGDGAFEWSAEDVQLLRTADVFVAADVFYDESATTAFFTTVQHYFSELPPKTLYLSLEKRINFSLEDCDVSAPAYAKFEQCLRDLRTREGDFAYDVQKLPTDFCQCFQYCRVKQLELWRISASWK